MAKEFLSNFYTFFEREIAHYLLNLSVGKIPKIREEFSFLPRSSCDTIAFPQALLTLDYISAFLSHSLGPHFFE